MYCNVLVSLNILNYCNLPWVVRIWTSFTWFDSFIFRLEPIRATAPSTSKNITQFKSGQKWLKNNHFATFTKFCIKKYHFILFKCFFVKNFIHLPLRLCVQIFGECFCKRTHFIFFIATIIFYMEKTCKLDKSTYFYLFNKHSTSSSFYIVSHASLAYWSNRVRSTLGNLGSIGYSIGSATGLGAFQIQRVALGWGWQSVTWSSHARKVTKSVTYFLNGPLGRVKDELVRCAFFDLFLSISIKHSLEFCRVQKNILGCIFLLKFEVASVPSFVTS